MATTTLPPMEHTFTVSIKGELTGKVYDGTFTFKIPTLRQESEISKTYSRLNEGLELPTKITGIHYAAAYLYHTITDGPEWWENKASALEIHDANVYMEIFNECFRFQDEWKEKVWSEDEETPKSKKDSKTSK